MSSTSYSTSADLARHFKVTRATINAMVNRGDIPAGMYIRMGRRGVLRFDLAKVEAHLLATNQVPELRYEQDPRQMDMFAATPTNQET